MKQKEERETRIVYVFDSMHNDSGLLKHPSHLLCKCVLPFQVSFSSRTSLIDLRNENCFGFDDILNCCLCEGKLSVTATNVSV